jgi:hypothetical protein
LRNILEREIGKDLKGTVDEYDLLPPFRWSRFPIGQQYHRSNVRAHLLACLPPLIAIYRRLYRGKQPWPIHLIMKCEPISDEKEQLGKFRPRSDLLVSKSSLPRLLVEVNSKPKKDRPEDLVRMLLTGAAIVRLANIFLDRFMVFKNFVFCAMYVWDSGEVSRYSLYQEFNNPDVCWTSYISKLAG